MSYVYGLIHELREWHYRVEVAGGTGPFIGTVSPLPGAGGKDQRRKCWPEDLGGESHLSS